MIVDDDAIAVFDALREDPEAAIADPYPLTKSAGIQAIQVQTLAWISQRFELRVVANGPDGISVVELVPEGDLGTNLRDFRMRLRCRISRTPAHRVFRP